jgi:hypothetical protein
MVYLRRKVISNALQSGCDMPSIQIAPLEIIVLGPVTMRRDSAVEMGD